MRIRAKLGKKMPRNLALRREGVDDRANGRNLFDKSGPAVVLVVGPPKASRSFAFQLFLSRLFLTLPPSELFNHSAFWPFNTHLDISTFQVT